MRVALLVFAVLACVACVAAIPVLEDGADMVDDNGMLVELSTAGCEDKRPKGSEGYTCAQQKAWGKCSASWMKGYCQKSCGKCSGGGGGGGGGGSSTPKSGGGASLSALGIKGSSSRSAPLKSYGSNYASNKKKVVASLKRAGFSGPQVKMMLAIAMLETNTMDPNSRDKAKTGDSTNYGLFNVNRDMLNRIGSAKESYNTWAGLDGLTAALKKAVKTYGVNGFLNYLRGGYTGWKDGKSYGCQGYRNGIASMVKIIDANPSLMSDDRRIDMVVEHV